MDRSHVYMLNSSPFDFPGQQYKLFNTQGGALKYVDLTKGVFTGAVGGDNLVPNVTGFEYLVVKYDGANGESYVINVKGITGDVQVPTTDPRRNAHNKYLLFNDSTSNVSFLDTVRPRRWQHGNPVRFRCCWRRDSSAAVALKTPKPDRK